MGYWVIIEAGGKQRFIFGTNKRRANVGASQLVYETQSWVTDAVADSRKQDPSIEVVLLDSGTANLIVQDRAVAQQLVGQVTATALERAPGLDVWGVVHEIDTVDPMRSRGAAYRALDHARGMRPSVLLRGPMLPVTQPCRFTGRPASYVLTDKGLSSATPASRTSHDELADATAAADTAPADPGAPEPEPVWVSREFCAAYVAGNPRLPDASGHIKPSPSRKRLASYIPTKQLGLTSPNAILCRTNEEFTGWVGLMHADGDGMGALFTAIGTSGTKQQLKTMSTAVAQLATSAVSDAVIATERRARALGLQGPWLLPLIVGGDDVTALVDGRVAVDFAVEYARAFDKGFAGAGFQAGREILGKMRAVDPKVPQRLTVSAGVALVKPHHPFSNAAELAEGLCRSAKQEAGSTVDFHVLFDSVGSNLDAVREPLCVAAPHSGELALWGGPYTTEACGKGHRCECPSFTHLEEVTTAMRVPVPTDGGRDRPLIGGTIAHRLRDALTSGGAAITRASEQVKLRTSAEAWNQINGHVVIAKANPAANEPGFRSRWLDAIALSDVQEGTV